MTKEAKRIGRPTKAPARGKRVSLGLKVTADIKRRLDSARASGRTQSQEAEHRIELSYQYERVLGELEQAKKKLAEMTQENTEAKLRQLGWGTVTDIRYGGRVWLPPERHRFPQSGWIDPNDKTPVPSPEIVPDPQFVDAVVALIRAIPEPIVRVIKTALNKEGGK
jgi:hypothetical protein